MEAPALDSKMMAGLRSMDAGSAGNFLAKLVSSYRDASIELVRELRDADRVRKSAHTLKSSSANLAALNLSSLCKNLEDAGRGQKLQHAAPLLA